MPEVIRKAAKDGPGAVHLLGGHYGRKLMRQSQRPEGPKQAGFEAPYLLGRKTVGSADQNTKDAGPFILSARQGGAEIFGGKNLCPRPPVTEPNLFTRRNRKR
jgi:hypothetical protein